MIVWASVVVLKSVPAGCVVAGVPAKTIKGPGNWSSEAMPVTSVFIANVKKGDG